MTTGILRAALALATLWPMTACLTADDGEDTLGTEEGEVINGTTISAEGSGFVRLGTTVGACSGTLINNQWILTAKRCVGPGDVATPNLVTAVMGSQFRTGAAISTNPYFDVVLIRASAAFAMNGSTTGFQTTLFPSATNTLAPGTMLTCRGFGEVALNTGAGIGTLRTANMPVRGVNFSWWGTNYDLGVNASATNQFLGNGDWGGSCSLVLPSGEKALVGVTNTLYSAFDGTFNGLVSADNFRWWLAATVTPSTNVVQQWGTAGDIPVPGNFSGPTINGADDFVVYRPVGGMWHVRDAVSGAMFSQQWGLNGDIPLRGDYNGDGHADYAIYRPNGGLFAILINGTGEQRTRQLGANGDVPVPGDYDGDGKTDYAVWRPSTGVWTVIKSSTGAVVTQQWGQNGDVPVAADYDRDGRFDFAVFRPSTSTWHVIDSWNGAITSTVFGTAGDTPLGAFTGCAVPTTRGLTVWRQTTGGFFRHGAAPFTLGQWGDIPVPANFGGNAGPDFAVWRPSDGTWYVQLDSPQC